VFRRGQQAGFVFAEHAITITRDYPIHPIPQYPWQNAARARQTPNATERVDHVENCVGAHQHPLSRMPMINHYVEGIEIARVCAMSFEDCLGKFALQRRKTKPVVNIALQNKLNQTVAESADAVVENYRTGFRNVHNTSDRAA